jgi:hypothetical protein
MNELEKHLRSWALRQPSPRLEQKLFHPDVAAELPPRFSFQWLAPATAALLLACMLFNQRNGPSLAGYSSSQIVAVSLSNQSAAAYLPGSFKREQNILSADTFEWTNGAGSTSSITSLSPMRGTN